jgi:hypothetical protein
VNDPKSISPRICVLVRNDLVARNVHVAFDLGFLKSIMLASHVEPKARGTHRPTPQIIQMRALEHEIPQLPRVISVPFLPHPPAIIRLANLVHRALARLQRGYRQAARTARRHARAQSALRDVGTQSTRQRSAKRCSWTAGPHTAHGTRDRALSRLVVHLGDRRDRRDRRSVASAPLRAGAHVQPGK